MCPLVGATLLSCAIEQNEFPLPTSLSAAGDGGMGGGSAGTAAGAFANGVSGSSPAAAGHGGSGGTFGTTGGASFGGSFTNAGSFGEGGLSGGAGGKASGGAGGSGGKATGGSGGKANGGAAGSGGGSTQCSGVKIPAKNSWKASALRASAGDPPERAIDGDDATRFSTGAAQAGDEWLQIDFGASVTLNEVSMLTSNDDYFRHYQLRLSDKSEDFAAAILKEGDGMTGTVTASLPQTHKGRYLTIRQTGKVMPAWWSLFEVDVACN